MKAAMVLSGLFWLLCGIIVVMSSGCSSATGWRVSFGVAPVKSIHDEAYTVQKMPVRKVTFRNPSDTGY
jgi:hypothetical protein